MTEEDAYLSLHVCVLIHKYMHVLLSRIPPVTDLELGSEISLRNISKVQRFCNNISSTTRLCSKK